MKKPKINHQNLEKLNRIADKMLDQLEKDVAGVSGEQLLASACAYRELLSAIERGWRFGIVK